MNDREKWLEGLVEWWADWLVDAVAGATQNRALLRHDEAEDKALTEAILANGRKALTQCLKKALAQHSEPGREECGWSLDDEGYYQTDCGTEFETVDFLRLEEMPSMKHCANCGRRIRDDSPAPDADERE